MIFDVSLSEIITLLKDK